MQLCTPSKIQTVSKNSNSVYSEHWPAKVTKYSINYSCISRYARVTSSVYQPLVSYYIQHVMILCTVAIVYASNLMYSKHPQYVILCLRYNCTEHLTYCRKSGAHN